MMAEVGSVLPDQAATEALVFEAKLRPPPGPHVLRCQAVYFMVAEALWRRWLR